MAPIPAGHWMLLVEGSEDAHVLYHICQLLGLPVVKKEDLDVQEAMGVRIVPFNGIEKLGGTLYDLLNDINVDRVGIVADWDDPEHIPGQDSRWTKVRGMLAAHRYAPPEAPDATGTILVHPKALPEDVVRPNVGVWLMPDNRSPGMIEDFAALLIRPGDGLWPLAQATVLGLPEHRFGEAHMAKAQIHTWLAWQKPPGNPIGRAISQSCLDLRLPIGMQFGAWLVRLFGAAPGPDAPS